jgi:two-component system, NarL family, nitrate/nitrite response regulator NarL
MANSLDREREIGVGPYEPPQAGRLRAAVIDTVIVSDVRLYREGLALGLDGRNDVRIVGTTETFEGACVLLASSAAPIVLLDAGMAQPLDFARRLLLAAPTVRIVAVAVADDNSDVLACAEAGLSGYVLRDGSIADVAVAIRDAMFDELHCSPRVSATLFKRLAQSARPPMADVHSLLTPREVEVVELVDRGLSNKEIGQRLHIGTTTVKNHVHNILEKLNVSRRAEAAAHVRSQRVTGTTISPRGVVSPVSPR